MEALLIAVCILAKDEARNIPSVLKQLARQSFLRQSGVEMRVHVVANGCTDDTAEVARSCASLFGDPNSLQVHDLPQGGKSRTWNHTVHRLIDRSTRYVVFLDADITFTDDEVIAELIQDLESRPTLQVSAGYPVKDVETKPRKSLVDRLSLKLSSATRFVDAISGQLYAARADALRDIWLPDATPAEDGFINAMVNTCGFTIEPTAGRVRGHRRPTHYFEALQPLEFMRHERRLIIGTIINRWIFEYLWSLKLTSSAGPLIRDWNLKDPGWIERLIRERVGAKPWLIPNAILFGRLKTNHQRPLIRRIAFLPLALAATLITIPPSIGANRRLKKAGAASTW